MAEGRLLAATVRALREKAGSYLLVVAATTAAFIGFSFTQHNVYRAVTILAPSVATQGMGQLDSVLGQFGGLAALAGLPTGKDSLTHEAVAILESRAFSERFLESTGAMKTIVDERFGSRNPGKHRVVRHFETKVRFISHNRRSGLYSLSIEWTDPHLAAEWANSIVRILNQEMRSRAIADAGRNLEFLRNEAAATEQVVVRDAISRLIEGQVKQRMIASVTEGYAFRVVDPAVAPDRKDQIFPRRGQFALGGVAAGLFLVLALALRRAHRSAARPSPSGAT